MLEAEPDEASVPADPGSKVRQRFDQTKEMLGNRLSIIVVGTLNPSTKWPGFGSDNVKKPVPVFRVPRMVPILVLMFI
jgi:hypothetical protein